MILCLRLGTRRRRRATTGLLTIGKLLGEVRILGGTVVGDGRLRRAKLARLHVLGLGLRRLLLLLLVLRVLRVLLVLLMLLVRLLLLLLFVMLVVVLEVGLLVGLLAWLLGWRRWRGRLLLGGLGLVRPVGRLAWLYGRVSLLGRLLRVELLGLLGRKIGLGLWRIRLFLWSLVGRVRRWRRRLLLLCGGSGCWGFRGLHVMECGA